MNFYIDPEKKDEVRKAREIFKREYSVNSENNSLFIRKNKSNIASYFEIFPESGEIKSVSPKEANSSHMLNPLISNERCSVIRIDDFLYTIFKQNPEELKN
jgi:hypothetical protein